MRATPAAPANPPRGTIQNLAQRSPGPEAACHGTGRSDSFLPERPGSAAMPVLVGAGLAVALGPGPGGFWDSFDYLRQMATFELGGGLLLGRTGFTTGGALVFAAARSLGLSPTAAAWSVTGAVLLTAALTTWLVARWLSELGVGSARSGALLWATSPVIAVLSFSVMSELPAMALVLLGLALSARAWRTGASRTAAAGAFAVGFALCVREPAVAWLPALVLVPLLSPDVHRRHAAAALVGGTLGIAAALGLTLLVFPDVLASLARWRTHMAAEAIRNAVSPLHQLRTWALWLLACAPVALLLALPGGLRLARGARRSPALLLAAHGLLLLLALLFYQDLSWGPRYLVPALPSVILLAACGLEGTGKRARITAALAVAAVVAAAVPVTAPLRTLAAEGRAAPGRLAALSPPGVLLPGWLCPALRFHAAAEGRPLEWTLLCPGWTWPEGHVAEELRRHLDRGTRVVALVEATLWPGPRFGGSLEELLDVPEHGLRLEPAGHDVYRVVTADVPRTSARATPPPPAPRAPDRP